MYAANFKKTEQNESTFRNLSAFGGFCGSLDLKPIKRSAFNIRRSMLDVRCSTFKTYSPPLQDSLFQQAEFHTKFQDSDLHKFEY
jgi:hypothetical protein